MYFYNWWQSLYTGITSIPVPDGFPVVGLTWECGADRQSAGGGRVHTFAAATACPVGDAPAGENGVTVADAAAVGMGPRALLPAATGNVAHRRLQRVIGQGDGGVHPEQPPRAACWRQAGHSLPKREISPDIPEPALT